MKKRRSPPRAAMHSDLGTPERRQHGVVAVAAAETTPGGMVVGLRAQVTDTTPLDRYLARRVITQRQHDAGSRLGGIFTAAVRLPSVTANWNVPTGGTGAGYEATLDVRRKLWAVLVAAGLAERIEGEEPLQVRRRSGSGPTPITGPVRLSRAGHIVLAVCGFAEFAGDKRRLAALISALDALADQFDGARHRPVTAPVRAWMDPTAATTDNPEARDLSWAAAQAEARRAIEAARRRKLGLD